ncbi:guanylate kinase [Nonomuraea sp. NPDC049486]|uniref:guanylate kinase n=1 Tax=Nonomuraea sp. NPDC049486 TaxID=3155773 RepID=UPI003432E92C
MTGIVLYGPPASGKSTVTAALTALDPRLVLLRKLKAGTWRGGEYEFVSFERLAELRAAGRLLVETRRYGNVYAVDRHQVEQTAMAGQVPVVHMGNIPDVGRLIEAGRWLPVMLWVSRAVCEQRSRERGDNDTAQRLRAWDETMADLHAHDEGLFVCRFHTDEVTPVEVARRIACAFVDRRAAVYGHRA